MTATPPRWTDRLLDLGICASLIGWVYLPPAPYDLVVAWVGVGAWFKVAAPTWRGLRGFYLSAALVLHALGYTAWRSLS